MSNWSLPWTRNPNVLNRLPRADFLKLSGLLLGTAEVPIIRVLEERWVRSACAGLL